MNEQDKQPRDRNGQVIGIGDFMEEQYGEVGKLTFFPASGDPHSEEYVESCYKITDRYGHRDDKVVQNREVISVKIGGKWQDILADYDGEHWQFRNARGKIIPLAGQYQARVKF